MSGVIFVSDGLGDGLIYLTELRFPQHALVQEWLNGTEYGERYHLVATSVTVENTNTYGERYVQRLFVPALKPIKGEEEFMLVLKGQEQTQKLAKEYTAMVLDFRRE